MPHVVVRRQLPSGRLCHEVLHVLNFVACCLAESLNSADVRSKFFESGDLLQHTRDPLVMIHCSASPLTFVDKGRSEQIPLTKC